MTLKFTRVMAGEYRCDADHGTYYIWAIQRIVTRGSWFRYEDCWTCRYGRKSSAYSPKIIGDEFRTYNEAKAAANKHHDALVNTLQRS